MSTLADDEVPPTPLNGHLTSANRSNSFPHQPTTSAAVQSFIDTSQPALNSVPIELDSTPLISPSKEGGEQQTSLLGNIADSLGAKVKEVVGNVKVTGGGGSMSSVKSEHNPAVLSGPVDEPAAEDFEAVQAEDKV